jgi:hypothetical protein
MYLLPIACTGVVELAAELLTNVLLLFGVLFGPVLFMGVIIWHAVKTGRDWVRDRKQNLFDRSLPCQNCCYFSNCEVLPCAVNPHEVLTAEARSCLDFSPIEALPIAAALTISMPYPKHS